jgi:hypothetical protein
MSGVAWVQYEFPTSALKAGSASLMQSLPKQQLDCKFSVALPFYDFQ